MSDLSRSGATDMQAGREPAPAYPPRSSENNQLVLRYFLFSVTPGRRVPPIARRGVAEEGAPNSGDADAKRAQEEEKERLQIAAAFDDGRAQASSSTVAQRITKAHAQELIAVSRTLRGSSGDMPESRPLELGTLARRCVELHHYHTKCVTASQTFSATTKRKPGSRRGSVAAGLLPTSVTPSAEGALSGKLSTEDVIPRITTPGLTREARKRLQAASRTYSTMPGDYVNSSYYESAMEAEESKMVSWFLGPHGKRQTRGAAAGGTRLNRGHRAAAPFLRTAVLPGSSSATSDVTQAQQSEPSATSVAISSQQPGIQIVDSERSTRVGLSPLITMQTADAPAAVVGAAQEPLLPQSPLRKRFIGGKRTAAQMRARRDLVEPTTNASALASAVLGTQREEADVLFCVSPKNVAAQADTAVISDGGGAPRSPPQQLELSKRTCTHDPRPVRNLADIISDKLGVGPRGAAASSLLALGRPDNLLSLPQMDASPIITPLVGNQLCVVPDATSVVERDMRGGSNAVRSLRNVIEQQRRAATPTIPASTMVLSREFASSSVSVSSMLVKPPSRGAPSR